MKERGKEAMTYLGINLTRPSEFNSEFASSNYFKYSSQWYALDIATGWSHDTRPLALDADGNVMALLQSQVAQCNLWQSIAPLGQPLGQYTLIYDGEAVIQISGATVVSSATGGLIFDLVHAGPVIVRLMSVNPANYPRNIQVRNVNDPVVGTQQNPAAWNKKFVDSITPFKRLRFMQSMGIDEDGGHTTSWASRPGPNVSRWSRPYGMPIESIVDLCNLTGAEPWICVPHMATDDYVSNLGLYLAQNLNGTGKIWIEWSNEVWHGAYPQSAYATQQGLAMGLSTSPQMARTLYTALRANQVFSILGPILGSRLVRVLGSFLYQPILSRTLLQHCPCDALAVAPYAGEFTETSAELAHVDSLTVDQLHAEIAQIDIPQTLYDVGLHAAMAHTAGVQLVGYEGGIELVGSNYTAMGDATLNALYEAMSGDPRMGDLTAQLLNGLPPQGMSSVMWYSHCYPDRVFDRFGARKTLNAQGPVYTALLPFAAQ